MKSQPKGMQRYTLLILGLAAFGILLFVLYSILLFDIHRKMQQDYEHLRRFGIEKGFYTSKLVIETIALINLDEEMEGFDPQESRELRGRILSFFDMYAIDENEEFLHGLDFIAPFYIEKLVRQQKEFHDSLVELLESVDNALSSPDISIRESLYRNYESIVEPFLYNARAFNDTLLQISAFTFSELRILNEKSNRISVVSFLLSGTILIAIIGLFLLQRSVQQQFAASLIKSERKLSSLFHSMLNAYAQHEIILDEAGRPVDYRFTEINPAFTEMTGLSREETIGRTVKELLPEVEDVLIEKYGGIALKGGRARFQNYVAAMNRHYDIQAFSLGYPEFATIFQDITERENLIQSLERARSQAEEGNEIKRQFLANISHEMRTPLNGILGMTSLLEGTGLTEEQQQLLQMLHISANTMYALVKDLLDFNMYSTKKILLNETRVSLPEFVQNIGTITRQRAQHAGLDFLGEEKFSAEYIVVDPNRLFQAVWNVLSNAIKFTEQGGVVLRVADTTEEVIFEIEDTGPGITASVQRHMFDLFYQGEDAYTKTRGGMGMGLSIAKLILEQMQGEIEYTGLEAGGSLFRIVLPLKVAEAEETLPQLPSVEEGTEKQRVSELAPVLIAEDEVVNRIYLRSVLRARGFEVLEAKNGREALTILSENQVSCILMDIGMPVMNGIDAAKEIRANSAYSELPIIAVTAHSADRDRINILEAGIDEIINKPVNLEELFTQMGDRMKIKLS